MNILEKKGIISRLSELNVIKPCPRCESINFEIIGDTLFNINENSWSAFRLSSTIIACSKCGFLTFHAKSILENKDSE